VPEAQGAHANEQDVTFSGAFGSQESRSICSIFGSRLIVCKLVVVPVGVVPATQSESAALMSQLSRLVLAAELVVVPLGHGVHLSLLSTALK